jgi:hypothetical protein
MPLKTSKKQLKKTKKNSMKKSSSCFNMFGGDGAADYATRVFGGPSEQVAVGAGSNAIKILNDPSKIGVAELMKGGSNLSPAEFANSNNSAESYATSVYGDMTQQTANETRGNEIAIINNPSNNQQMKGGMKILRNGDELEVSNDYVLAEGETIIPETYSEEFVNENGSETTPNPAVEPQSTSGSFLSNVSNFLNPNAKSSEVVAEKVVVEEKKQSGGKSVKKYTPAVLLYANPLYKNKKGKTQRKRKMRSIKKR